MRLFISLIAFIVAVVIAPYTSASDLVSLRIRFGMKDKQATDWSGRLSMSSGRVESIRGWRWAAGDSAEGDSWTVSTRRPPAQSAAEKARVQAGGKMPMTDNGLIVTL